MTVPEPHKKTKDNSSKKGRSSSGGTKTSRKQSVTGKKKSKQS